MVVFRLNNKGQTDYQTLHTYKSGRNPGEFELKVT